MSLQGLTPEEQRGLFGELYFLRNLFKTNNNYLKVLDTWIGPEKQNRDFQFNNWAVEIKTTHGNNHQKVQINSERQLDITHIEHLFLYHISLDKQQKSGDTLNDIIDSVYDILKNNTIALYRFKSKLYEVGYFDLQRHLYDIVGYHIRQDTYYKVEKNFPRIEETDIRSGVGDVKYSIILTQCESYEITATEVFQIVKI
jgi:hypothetical protein